MATVVVSAKPLHSAAHGGTAGVVDPDALPHTLYLPAWRPWLALYGARVRPAGHRRAQEVGSFPQVHGPLSVHCVWASGLERLLSSPRLLSPGRVWRPFRRCCRTSCCCTSCRCCRCGRWRPLAACASSGGSWATPRSAVHPAFAQRSVHRQICVSADCKSVTACAYAWCPA
jgi:hypothetical protein